MNKSRAIELLAAARAGGQDHDDPEIRQALDMAAHDPELAAVLVRQQAIDSIVVKAVRSDEPPTELREQLLQIPASVETAPAATVSSVKPMRRAIWLTAVACLVLAIIGTWYDSRSAPGTHDTLAKFAIEETMNGLQLAKFSDDQTALRQWLAASNSPHEFTIPEALGKYPAKGCQTFSVDGRQMSLICFKVEDGRFVHLFVVNNSGDLQGTDAAKLAVVNYQSQAALTWSDGTNTYFLTCEDMPAPELKRFI